MLVLNIAYKFCVKLKIKAVSEVFIIACMFMYSFSFT